jgi:cation-transporting P-type ATPase E
MAVSTQEAELPPGVGRGLTEAEAAERKARGEYNKVDTGPSRSYARIVFQNAITPINVTLIAICIGLAAFSLFADSVMTGSLVVLNVVVGVFQEVRAKRKLDKISLLTRPTAVVVRDGQPKTVDQEQIVLGDVVLIKAGDQVLVDGEVPYANGLMIDESLLTGESDLVPKKVGDRVQSGTFCMAGNGAFVADKVGGDSLVQQLTAQARKFRNTQTPLQREVGFVLRIMAVAVVALSVQVLLAYRGSEQGMSASESLRAAAVLVSLVPQGLSFMVTTTYAMAVVRMAGSGALIQRINAVESTSSVNMLCLDKTGTLTTNNLKLEEITPLAQDGIDAKAAVAEFAASVGAENRTIEAIKADLPGQKREVVTEIPFSSDRKWSALAFEDAVYVLGAPEMIEPAIGSSESYRAKLEEQAAQGLRVLLFAKAPAQAISNEEPRLADNLQPIALISLRDELRPEARETLEQFATAGIGIKIISGDSPETVVALAKQAGLSGDIKMLSGIDIEEMSDEELKRRAEETTVFGRITPQQKERLIRLLRKRGRHIAMIGDGVNDVLALKRSDLAIAMRSGSQVTRSIADIVLLEDSFATLPKAFLEGQRIRRGMLDIIRLFLVRTLSVALIILACSIVSDSFPTTPRQNGVLAFLTVGIPTLALAAWARPAQTPRQLVLWSAHFVLPAAISIALVGFGVYELFLWNSDVDTSRSALTTTTVLCGIVLLPFVQPPTRAFVGGAPLNGDWKIIWLAGAMVLLYVAILAIPPVRDFYELTVLNAADYALIVLIVAAWAVVLRTFWRWNLPEHAKGLYKYLTAELEELVT